VGRENIQDVRPRGGNVMRGESISTSTLADVYSMKQRPGYDVQFKTLGATSCGIQEAHFRCPLHMINDSYYISGDFLVKMPPSPRIDSRSAVPIRARP
jgi:hypothetical protein